MVVDVAVVVIFVVDVFKGVAVLRTAEEDVEEVVDVIVLEEIEVEEEDEVVAEVEDHANLSVPLPLLYLLLVVRWPTGDEIELFRQNGLMLPGSFGTWEYISPPSCQGDSQAPAFDKPSRPIPACLYEVYREP